MKPIPRFSDDPGVQYLVRLTAVWILHRHFPPLMALPMDVPAND